MNKSTKGALAAGAAASLLLGGAGSLAYWTDTGTVTGSSITSGHLKLVPASTPACDGWKLDGETALFDPAIDTIVPGDVLTQVCSYTVDAVGNHLTATFDVTGPTWKAGSDSALTNEVVTTATYTLNGSATMPPTAIANGDVVEAAVTVTFTGTTATNGSEDMDAALDNITVTATQSHL